MAALSPAVALAIADGEASDRPSRALVTYRLQVLVVTFTTFHDLGLRYTFLKSHRLANCTFTFDQMVGEEGNTFVFLLNTQAKIRRITDNSRKDIDELKKGST